MFENVIGDDDIERIWRQWETLAAARQERCSDIVQGGKRTPLYALPLFWLYASYGSRTQLGVPNAPAAIAAAQIKNVFAFQ